MACSVPGRGSPRFRVFRIFIFSSTFSPAKRQRKSRRESVEIKKKIVDFFLKNFEEFLNKRVENDDSQSRGLKFEGKKKTVEIALGFSHDCFQN